MSNLTLMPWAPSQWTDSLGNILEFGILRFYEADNFTPVQWNGSTLTVGWS